MLGIGSIYASYVQGEIDGDDEAAVEQAPDGEWDALIWPVVNVRAVSAGVLEASGPPSYWWRCARCTTCSAPRRRCGPCAVATEATPLRPLWDAARAAAAGPPPPPQSSAPPSSLLAEAFG